MLSSFESNSKKFDFKRIINHSLLNGLSGLDIELIVNRTFNYTEANPQQSHPYVFCTDLLSAKQNGDYGGIIEKKTYLEVTLNSRATVYYVDVDSNHACFYAIGRSRKVIDALMMADRVFSFQAYPPSFKIDYSVVALLKREKVQIGKNKGAEFDKPSTLTKKKLPPEKHIVLKIELLMSGLPDGSSVSQLKTAAFSSDNTGYKGGGGHDAHIYNANSGSSRDVFDEVMTCLAGGCGSKQAVTNLRRLSEFSVSGSWAALHRHVFLNSEAKKNESEKDNNETSYSHTYSHGNDMSSGDDAAQREAVCQYAQILSGAYVRLGTSVLEFDAGWLRTVPARYPTSPPPHLPSHSPTHP